MAGSRLERLGSIFTRVQGLLRSGALKYEERPLWYDIYKRFPPKTNPVYNRDVPTDKVRTLLYSEDLIRARFFNEFSHNPDLVDLADDNKKLLISERFIHKYNAHKTDKVTEDAAFDMARNALKAEGVNLKTWEDIRKAEVEKLKAEARERTPSAGGPSPQDIQQAPKRSFTAAELFGDAAKRRGDDDDDVDAFMDEEFFDSEDVREMLKAPGEEVPVTDKHRKPKS